MDNRIDVKAVAVESAHRHSVHCRNCGASAPEEFCPRCGQETAEDLPSAFEFVHEFVLHYLAAEGKLWRTLRALILKPGFLTNEYLHGRKRAYVLPLRLYLTVSVVFFLALQLTFSLATTAALGPAFEKRIRSGELDLEVGPVFWTAHRHRDGSYSCNLPQPLCERLKGKLFSPPEELEKIIWHFPQEVFSHMSSALFALLPIFALCLKVAYWKRSYGEHFLFALHIHSLWFLALLLMLLALPQWLEAGLLMYLLGFSIISLQRVYGGPAWRTVAKGLGVTAAYLIILLAATSLLGLWALLK